MHLPGSAHTNMVMSRGNHGDWFLKNRCFSSLSSDSRRTCDGSEQTGVGQFPRHVAKYSLIIEIINSNDIGYKEKD